MIVIMVGQGLLGRQQELQAEEQFKTTITSYHDIEQIMEHLSSQDEELVKQTSMLIQLLRSSGIPLERVVAVQEKGNPTNNGSE
jgi:hypothetical protein